MGYLKALVERNARTGRKIRSDQSAIEAICLNMVVADLHGVVINRKTLRDFYRWRKTFTDDQSQEYFIIGKMIGDSFANSLATKVSRRLAKEPPEFLPNILPKSPLKYLVENLLFELYRARIVDRKVSNRRKIEFVFNCLMPKLARNKSFKLLGVNQLKKLKRQIGRVVEVYDFKDVPIDAKWDKFVKDKSLLQKQTEMVEFLSQHMNPKWRKYLDETLEITC